MIIGIGIAAIIFIVIIYAIVSTNKIEKKNTDEPRHNYKKKNYMQPPVRKVAHQELYNFLNFKNKAKLIFFDLETNGLKGSSVLSVFAIKIEMDKKNHNMKILDSFERYYYPKEPFNIEAVKINGLNREKIDLLRNLDEYPLYFENDPEFENFCSDTIRFIAHNIKFDEEFLNFKIKKSFCTMISNTDIVRTEWKEYKGEFKYPTLQETALFYNIPIEREKFHESYYDTKVLFEIFKEMYKRFRFAKGSNSFCPYCNFELPVKPQKMTVCPKCNNKIFVRTKPHTRFTSLVTEDNAKKIDSEYGHR